MAKRNYFSKCPQSHRFARRAVSMAVFAIGAWCTVGLAVNAQTYNTQQNPRRRQQPATPNQYAAQQGYQQHGYEQRGYDRQRSVRSAAMRSPNGIQQPPIMHFQETANRIDTSAVNSSTSNESADVDILFAKDLGDSNLSQSSGSRPMTNSRANINVAAMAKPISSQPRKPLPKAAGDLFTDSETEPAQDADGFSMLLPKPGQRRDANGKSGSKSPFQLTQKAGIGLGIALSAFFGLVWLLKKTGGSSSSQGAIPQQVVQILGRAPLNTKQNMQLVRLGDKILLLAISTTGTESLGEITDRDEVDAITEICQSKNSRRIKETFRQTLQRVRGERSDPNAGLHSVDLQGRSFVA